MIRLDDNHFMMIEPTRKAHPVIIDSLTRRVCAAMRRAVVSRDSYRGFHGCVCGMTSDNKDHLIYRDRATDALPSMRTNSLAIHYIACHRDEVPESELAKARSLADNESDPIPDELYARGSTMRSIAEPDPSRDADQEC